MTISSRGFQVIVCSYVSVLISALFTSLRLFVRWRLVKITGKEDACIFFAWIAALVCAITMHLDVTMGGLGQRVNTLTPAHITTYFKMAYVSILSYNTSLCLTKFAILLFCLRLFAPSSWRKVYFAVLAFISIYTIWVVATSIVPCVPVGRYWNKSVQGGCLPNGVLWFLNAGLNIFSDFIVVLLPIPSILSLQLPKKQKIGVSLIFALGLL
ncbi:hypothetical protein BKA66DRAFT_282990 [Pyrenochaeta sp. MPI-SDFR-AT-0127]|nr:hypothetical protein BKA66DRAFT_282990 [Pyrenochaeta sp. MPI-SDFR-AT-0127]